MRVRLIVAAALAGLLLAAPAAAIAAGCPKTSTSDIAEVLDTDESFDQHLAAAHPA